MIMRDPKRIPEVLAAIREIWEKNPGLRFGQLLLNLGNDFNYYVEDDQLIKTLKKVYKEIENEK